MWNQGRGSLYNTASCTQPRHLCLILIISATSGCIYGGFKSPPPPQIWHFIWWVIHDCLATGNLWHRRLGSGFCRLCGGSLESLVHLCFQCSFAKAVWEQISWSLSDTKRHSFTLFSILQHGLMTWESEFFKKFCVVLWCIWLAHDKHIFCSTTPSVDQVCSHVAIILSFAYISSTTNPHLTASLRTLSISHVMLARAIFAHFNGSLCHYQATIEVLIRCNDGSIIGGLSGAIRLQTSSPEIVEALAFIHAIYFVHIHKVT